MKAKRILILTIEPPLPFGTAAARWYYVLYKGLLDRGHKVTVLAAHCKPSEIKQAQELFPSSKFDLRMFPKVEKKNFLSRLNTFRKPFSYMFSPEFHSVLNSELKADFDILHMEQLWAGWLGLKYIDRSLVNVHHLQFIDLENVVSRHLRGRLIQKLLFRTEKKLLKKYKYIRSSSPRLIDPIKKLNTQSDVSFVPIALDPDLYQFNPDSGRPQNPVVGLFGQMEWYPTQSAAIRLLEILWPKIKERVPNVKLLIVGWGARRVLSKYLKGNDIEICEDVPEIQPYFDRTSIFLYAPVRGSGMKIKVLEAMAFGVPVVTTSEGIEGLPAKNNVHVELSDTDEGLIEKTVNLLSNPLQQNSQRLAARQLIEEICNPQSTVTAIENIYTSMVEGRT